MKKYTHIISINLLVEKNTEDAPSHKEIKKALEKWLEDNKDDYFEGIEWVDTEENS